MCLALQAELALRGILLGLRGLPSLLQLGVGLLTGRQVALQGADLLLQPPLLVREGLLCLCLLLLQQRFCTSNSASRESSCSSLPSVAGAPRILSAARWLRLASA